jgi:hypothetical protein
MKLFAIFKNRKKAINVCINRFDDDTKSSFLDLYKNIDASALDVTEETTEEVVDTTI